MAGYVLTERSAFVTTLRDTDPVVITAIKAVLGKSHADIYVMVGSVTDSEVSAVVSPANSFGFMDAGIDKYFLSHDDTIAIDLQYGRHPAAGIDQDRW